MKVLTQSRLMELLDYDPDTGLFTWRQSRAGNATAGKVAGSNREGHVTIGVDGTQYYAHRLAVLYMTGALPAPGMHTDHINRVKDDNRWVNLRVVSHGDNMRNRAIDGYRQLKNGRWMGQISASFETEEEARDFRAYLEQMRDQYLQAKETL